MYEAIKKQILQEIKENDTIIICRHICPDGDCIGSSIGLRNILRATFKEKKIYSIGTEKSEYTSFFNDEDQDVPDEVYKEALIIVVDTATKIRIDNPKCELGKKIIKIDHHIAVDSYGDINYVREDFPSCATIIADFQKTFSDELIMHKDAALPLYVGMVTDTGRFRYQGVNGNTMTLAGNMIDKGLDLEKIFMNLYIKEKETLKLQAYVYKNFKTTENGVSYIYFSLKTIKKYQTTIEEASSLVNLLDSIKGSLIWIAFIEQNDKSIRARIRSRFVAVNKIAEEYEGGGHANASGGTAHNQKQVKTMIKEYDELLKDFKEENPDLV